MKMNWGKRLYTYEEAACQNELVDMVTRSVNAGIIAMEQNDVLPRHIENLSRERLPVCKGCGNADLRKLSVVYYDRIGRGFWGIGNNGIAVMADDYDNNMVGGKDKWAANAAGYFLACHACGDENKYDGEIEF